ncbi:MAG: hypothetical protein JRH08_18990 [Deltaproteobacteria bacterium]|nr:hypothetical protein [Deltaproteobacteria bacterium]MBW2026006.1 hypothetical protein [Deltaproteobacteria bacterium]MBW2127670.1 hypothetical protein [Deltaproteobacteria bacterium]
MQKIGFWGSIASIIGLIIYFSPIQSRSGDYVQNLTITHGNQSPAIMENKGNININYNNQMPLTSKSYVLRNPGGGSVLVVSLPSIEAVTDQSKHICLAIAGTPISLLPETVKKNGIEWRKIEIKEGLCAGKIGWVVTENVSYE